jgi:hypothetical protein
MKNIIIRSTISLSNFVLEFQSPNKHILAEFSENFSISYCISENGSGLEKSEFSGGTYTTPYKVFSFAFILSENLNHQTKLLALSKIIKYGLNVS